MATPLVKDADPPLATIMASGDPALAACVDGDYYFVDFTDDYLVDWCPFNAEAELGGTPITVEADPPLAPAGVFDTTIFSASFYEGGSVRIDEALPTVAIMVEADL